MFTGKDAIMFGDEHPFHLIYDQWLSTFREVKNQGDAIRLLPMGVLPKDGLYRVEAEGEVIKQCRNEDYDEWKERMVASGNPKNVGKTTANLGTMAISGLLPTPNAADHPGKNTGKRNQDSLPKRIREAGGQTSQLNPLFVEEMMGFPEGWTVSPFQSGETKPSKPMGTQSYPKSPSKSSKR